MNRVVAGCRRYRGYFRFGGKGSALIDAGVDAVVIDTAHITQGVGDMLRLIRRHSRYRCGGGKCGHGEAARFLVNAGADGVKVGISARSICTTRVIAGWSPQLSAI